MSINIHAARSNPALFPPTGNLKRILGNQYSSFRTMYNQESPGRAGISEQESKYTLNQTFSSLDRKGLPLSPTLRAQSDSATVIPVVESSTQVCDLIQQIVAEKGAQGYFKLSQ